MTLYGRKCAFNVQKVLWFLQEIDLDFNLIEVGGDFGGLDTPEFLSKNINGTIPVLDDNGFYIWESHTILRYLAGKYGNSYYGSSPLERSNYERWMDWGQTTLQPTFMKLFWGYYRQPEEKRNYKIIYSSIQECNKLLDILEKTLDNKSYLLGENLSLGDISTGSILYRLVNMGVDITLPNNVNSWYLRLQIRDAYRKWVMSDFSSLKGKKSY